MPGKRRSVIAGLVSAVFFAAILFSGCAATGPVNRSADYDVIIIGAAQAHFPGFP